MPTKQPNSTTASTSSTSSVQNANRGIARLKEFTDGAPKSMKTIGEEMDQLFWGYGPANGIDVAILTWLENNGGVTGLLKAVHPGKYNFDSTSEMTVGEVIQFLTSISEIGQSMYDGLESDQKDELRKFGGDSPIGFAGKKFFMSDEIVTRDIVRLELYFRKYLPELWIKNTTEAEQQEKENMERISFSRNIQSLINVLVYGYFHRNNPEQTRNTLQRLLFLIAQFDRIPLDSICDFNARIQRQVLGLDIDPTYIVEVVDLVQQIIRESLGIYAVYEFTPVQVQAVLIGSVESKTNHKITLSPQSNFYFRKQEEFGIDPSNLDEFPDMGQMISNKEDILVRNSSIFEPSGKKVWWGDISRQDLKKIHSTHYILTEQDSYLDVPLFVRGGITASYAAKDPHESELIRIGKELGGFRDIPYIQPDYVRLMAKYRVQQGVTEQNTSSFSLDELRNLRVE